jgi:hypothetical protein
MKIFIKLNMKTKLKKRILERDCLNKYNPAKKLIMKENI